MKNFLRLILLILLFNGISKTIRACTCMEMDVPVCEQFQRADAVFIGRVKSVEPLKEPTKPFAYTIINFEVEKPFKRINESVVKVGYVFGTSCSWIEKFEKGERWLIYGYRDAPDGMLTIPFCTNSHSIAADENLSYFNEFLQGKTRETIVGSLIGDGISNNVGVTVTGNGKTYTAQTDANGGFDLEVNGAGNYKVKTVIPFSVTERNLGLNRFAPLDILSLTEKETVSEYEIQVEKGLCGYRQVNFERVDLKATAAISGRVIGSGGKPIADLTVRLAKAELSEKEVLNRNQYATTDANGNFDFSELREGRYLILVNARDFPEYRTPYLKTFYPGVRNYSEAQPIEIEQGQKLSDVIFQMPKEIPQRKVEGNVFWENGSPVTTKDKPYLSFYTSNGDYIGTPDEPFKVDDNGRFSISLFEGFSYLIKVEADSKNERMHGFTEIKIGKNSKPVKITLNRKGFGNAEEYLKESKGKK